MNVKVNQIVLQYLSSFPDNYIIPMHLIETELPNYGRTQFGIIHSPGTYSRSFRKMREDGLVKIEWVKKEKSKEKHFKIVKE